MKNHAKSFAAVTCSSLAALAFTFVACGHDPPPPAQAPGATQPAITTTSAPAPQKALSLAVAPDIRKLCGIGDVEEAPKFDYDSALLSDADRAMLRELA